MRHSEWADLCWDRAKRDLEAVRILSNRGFHEPCITTCYIAVEKSIWAFGDITREEAMAESHSIVDIASGHKAPESILELLKAFSREFSDLEFPSRETLAAALKYTAQDGADRISKTEAIMAWVEGLRLKDIAQ